MRLSSGSTHQSISGRCWTKGDFWSGSIVSFLARSLDVCWSPDSGGIADIPQRPLRAQTV